MYGSTLLFLEPHSAGKTKFVIGVDHKLNTRGIKFSIVLRKIDLGGRIGNITDTN
jgi:hypothetical protein